MKKIQDELLEFFADTGFSASELSRESGVYPVCISRLRTGKQRDAESRKVDALRLAMKRLRGKKAAKAR